MRRMKSKHADQTLLEHNGYEFSVIDLAVVTQHIKNEETRKFASHYPFSYELAEIQEDGKVVILDRFTSVENAKIYIEANY